MNPSDLREHFQKIMKRRNADVSFDRFEAAEVRSDGVLLHLDVVVPEGSPRATVVFIPGTAVYGLIFADFLAALADAGLNVVSVDPRGHGLSRGKRGSYTIPDLVTDARAAVRYARERFGGPIFIAGSSQGGIAAFYTAATAEDLAGAICHNIADLGDPSKFELTDRPRLARALEGLVKRAAAVAPEAGLNMQLYFHLLSRKHQRVKDLLAADPLTVKVVRLKTLASLSSAELETPVEKIRTPVLILHGERDRIFPLSYIERLHRRLTCPKRLLVYPGVNHFLITEHASRVAPDVARWIDTTLTGEPEQPNALSN